MFPKIKGNKLKKIKAPKKIRTMVHKIKFDLCPSMKKDIV